MSRVMTDKEEDVMTTALSWLQEYATDSAQDVSIYISNHGELSITLNHVHGGYITVGGSARRVAEELRRRANCC